MRTLRAALFAMALTAGCASAPYSSQSDAYDRDVLRQDEIAASAQANLSLYVAIQSLRPNFLQAPPGVRRATATQGLAVYVDGTRQNGLESLRSLPASAVFEARYVDPMTAQNELGTAASSGALVVTLRRSPLGPP